MNQEPDLWTAIHEKVARLQGAFPIPEIEVVKLEKEN